MTITFYVMEKPGSNFTSSTQATLKYTLSNSDMKQCTEKMESSSLYTYEHDGGKARIGTFTGKLIDVIEPEDSDIDIVDIAHALSHNCRFGGHTREFYSVAQHSVFCSMLIEPEHALAALMHDASEAYLLDIPRPIKPYLTNYKTIESNLMKILAKKYGFQWPLHSKVKEIDEIALQKEWDSLMINTSDEIVPLSSMAAKEEFLKRFYALSPKC